MLVDMKQEATQRTKRKTLTSILYASMLLATAAPSTAQTLQPVGSEIVFTTQQLGVPVEGRFGKFSAQITLDPKAPERGSVMFDIDTGSVRFGAAELDGEVVKTGWLSSARFPQAVFKSSAIKAVAVDRFEVSGKLSIKGSERDVRVPVTLLRQGAGGSGGTATGSFTINRLDFKIGEAEWADTSLLAGEVVVRFKLVLSGLPAP